MQDGMNSLDLERVRAWQSAGPALDAMRQEEIRTSDARGIPAVIMTAEMLQRWGGEFRADSGLIVQQAWFAKLRHG